MSVSSAFSVATDSSGTTMVMVGSNGYMRRSIDGGATWAVLTSGTAEDLNGVAVGTFTSGGSDMWIAVGDAGVVLTSTDSTSWSSTALTGTPDLQAVSFIGLTAMVVGSGGAVFTSTDGSAWDQESIGTSEDLVDLTNYAGSYAILSSLGSVFTGLVSALRVRDRRSGADHRERRRRSIGVYPQHNCVRQH